MSTGPESHGKVVREARDEMISDPEKHRDSKPWQKWWKFSKSTKETVPPPSTSDSSSEGYQEIKAKPNKWSLGILNDALTDEVPGTIYSIELASGWWYQVTNVLHSTGSVLLMSKTTRNEPLGLRNAPGRTSASSLPSVYPPTSRPSTTRRLSEQEMKKTKDGTMILEPQPDDSMNDPLNWPALRRDVALLSLGFYCMLGGGMTPVLAAGFYNVAETYNVSVSQVALTTGLYMMGLGLGCVVTSPTAILLGKRPVYLVCIILFLLSSIWCAVSPNYASLVVARIFMGIIVIVVGFCFFLMFFFVPETFWDRTPHRAVKTGNSSFNSISGLFHNTRHEKSKPTVPETVTSSEDLTTSLQAFPTDSEGHTSIAHRRQRKKAHHVGFSDTNAQGEGNVLSLCDSGKNAHTTRSPRRLNLVKVETANGLINEPWKLTPYPAPLSTSSTSADVNETVVNHKEPTSADTQPKSALTVPTTANIDEKSPTVGPQCYTTYFRSQPPKTYIQTLKPWNGQLRHENWFKVALRPFMLFAYPAILWSALVYSLSIGWLIVLSESVSEIYRTKHYNFSSLGVGLVYISPFVGGILGAAVAGKVSDIVVRAMSRRNDGVYEPEFRLVMVIPVTVSTCIGLMGFGWSAAEKDKWIVPTIFFGIISFGSSLGLTTSITFAVDSYRMYAGEGLVTLNFSKNIFHGLVFSLFFNHWLEAEGSKNVFLAIGGIQLACLLTTIPMYIYGKRARMWTCRKNLMEKF
ncbi:MAG: hypothetical protein Q9209_001947 [Squamulea sp. 1 TL-2023]